MKYRKMGSLGWKVSALGFGAMRFPLDEKRRLMEEEAIRMIRYSIDNGVNYIDTGYTYHGGRSEEILGKALQDGYREKVHLTTKLPTWLVRRQNHFERYYNRQIKRLQTNPDIYLFHGLNGQRFKKVQELNLIESMENAKADGLVKHIGFSFHDSFEVFKEIIDSYQWDCCQIQLNYLDINYQAGLKGLNYAGERDIAVIIMEPIQGGKLVIPDDDLESKPLIKNVLQNSSNQRSMADWALQFLWNQKYVSVVLSGMSTMQQVVENIESADNSGINTLTESELKTIADLRGAFNKYVVVPCTRCNYCVPCSNDVSIPSILGVLNEIAYWGDRARQEYNQMAKTPEELETRRASGEDVGGAATLCTQCGECLEKCPQQIDIPQMMEIANGIFRDGKTISELLDIK
jgi:predicted aldo/keto reductase-like oxidoreductase